MPTSRTFALSSSAAPQVSSPFYQKHKMSLTQTYYLARTARSKLSKEAARSEYDLRVLVGHANLLDGLMIELAAAEREQEAWFNESVRRAESSTTSTSSNRKSSISWADTLPPVVEDDSESSSDESEDEDMIDAEEPVVTRRPAPVYASVTEMEVDNTDSESESDFEDDVAEDEESDSDELALTRTASRSSFSSPPDSPPELLHEFETSDEEEEESQSPLSPPTEALSADHLKGSKHNQHKMTVALKQDDAWQLSTGQNQEVFA